MSGIYEDMVIVDNPNELMLIESEIVTGKLDGEMVNAIQVYIQGRWVTQFALTDTTMLTLYHKLKKTCQVKGLL